MSSYFNVNCGIRFAIANRVQNLFVRELSLQEVLFTSFTYTIFKWPAAPDASVDNIVFKLNRSFLLKFCNIPLERSERPWSRRQRLYTI